MNSFDFLYDLRRICVLASDEPNKSGDLLRKCLVAISTAVLSLRSNPSCNLVFNANDTPPSKSKLA